MFAIDVVFLINRLFDNDGYWTTYLAFLHIHTWGSVFCSVYLCFRLIFGALILLYFVNDKAQVYINFNCVLFHQCFAAWYQSKAARQRSSCFNPLSQWGLGSMFARIYNNPQNKDGNRNYFFILQGTIELTFPLNVSLYPRYIL